VLPAQAVESGRFSRSERSALGAPLRVGGREVIERQQTVPVRGQIVGRLRVLIPEGCQKALERLLGEFPGVGPERSPARPRRPDEWQSGHGHGSDRSSHRERLDSGMELSYRCARRHSPCLKSVT